MKPRNMILLLMLAVVFPATAAQAVHGNHAGMSPSSEAYMDGMNNMHEGMIKAVQDPDADRAFARSMIEHHKGAIAMAETELRYGKSPAMRKMAERVMLPTY